MTAAACVVQNDQIAKHVRDYPKSFYGIATLPMQAPKAAADELERAISKLNLKGMQIGSNINGKNLDEPEFEPVWQVANQHNAFCMVHPNNVAGIDRLKNYYLNNLIGNPLDTTIAAACAGVRRRDRALSQHPLLHGARRRLHAIPGRPLAARLARPARAEEASEKSAGRDHPHLLLGHHPALASRSSNSWCRSSAQPTSSLAATIPTTWARSNARGRSRRCRCGELDKVTMLNGLVQKLLAGVK